MYPQFLRRAAAAAVALSILALSACGGSDDSSAGSQRAPKEVKIATIGSYLTIFSAMWAAQPGFDKIEKDFGTKISFQSFGKGADAMSAMLGGSVNVNAGTSSPDTVQAVLKGQDMVSIASLFTGPGLVFVGAKKLEKSHGTDIKAYDGATWGYTAEGSSAQINAQKVAEHNGLSWDHQKGVALGSIAAYEPALRTGRADIVAMDSTSAAIAITNGSGYEVYNANNLAVHGPVLGGPMPGNAVSVTKRFSDDYPELTQALATAIVEGLSKVRKATDATQAYDLMPAGFKKVHKDDDQFKTEWALTQPAFAGADGGYTPASISAVMTYSNVAEDQRPKVETALSDSYVEKAYDILGLPRPTL